MTPRPSSDKTDKAQPQETGPRDASKGERSADDAPRRERRAAHRVRDDQQSGQGSQSALSKLRMIERKRAALRPGRDDGPKGVS